MLAKALSGAVIGVQAFPVEVEVDSGRGLPAVVMVGLPDTAVKESRDRVKTALANSGFDHPDGRITINLAPADIKKEGPIFDLPIALSILAASKQLEPQLLHHFFMAGELALDGSLRAIRGILPLALLAREKGCRGLLVPHENAGEASVVEGLSVYPLHSLGQAVEFLEGKLDITPQRGNFDPAASHNRMLDSLDFAEVKGQESAKRAIEIAAAGGHNLLMVGNPGAGKSMLAKRIPTILPPLTLEEALETTRIHSVCGLTSPQQPIIAQRPFRSPHHTISDIGLIGGSANPTPGEVSLAHNGVLFMDELPEFKRSALEVLRQPLEDGSVTISRASGSLTFPSRFMFVAAMNPTPSGSHGDADRGKISHHAMQRYLNKISGPLLDRIDIHLEVAALEHKHLIDQNNGENSATIRQRIIQARQLQQKRYQSSNGSNGRKIWCNAQMNAKELTNFAPLDEESQNILRYSMEDLNLSARAYDRIRKVSRTIADLEESPHIRADHVSEAVQYRTLDRQLWG
ncbi:MAG: YifB family Mg chelatase-like AAA ATPase [Verrucomicrobiota bacterium]